jgi:hypothetical protein
MTHGLHLPAAESGQAHNITLCNRLFASPHSPAWPQRVQTRTREGRQLSVIRCQVSSVITGPFRARLRLGHGVARDREHVRDFPCFQPFPQAGIAAAGLAARHPLKRDARLHRARSSPPQAATSPRRRRRRRSRPPHRSRSSAYFLREQLVKRLRPRGMRIRGTCPRALHDTKHAAILAIGKPQVTQPHRAASFSAVVLLCAAIGETVRCE